MTTYTITDNEKNWLGEPRTSDSLILRRRKTVGRVGKMRSGVKVHVLIVTEVVGVVEDSVQPHGSYGALFVRRQASGDTRPVIYSSHGLCNGNGQHVGEEMTGYEVTCEKCLG